MRPPLALLALLLFAAHTRAQSATDFYHEAARHYVGGEREVAEAAAVRGLQQAPGDPKLQALLDRIRREEQQQSGQGDGQNQQPNPNQQGGEQGRGGGEGETQQDEGEERQDPGGTNRPEGDREGAASDRPPEAQPEPQPGEQQQEDAREDERGRPGAPRPGEGEATPESAEAAEPGQMTRAEAERILNAVGAEERLLLRRTQRRPGRGRDVEKDW